MKKHYNPFGILLLFRVMSWIAVGVVLFFVLLGVLGDRHEFNELPIGIWAGVFVFLRFFIAVIKIMSEIRDREAE